MVRFVHTADWHLGRYLGKVPDPGHRQWLWELRFEVLRQIGAVVAGQNAQFVVVAGDLFESHEVSDVTVAKGLEAITGLGVPVLAIPGNHDFGVCGPHGVWQRRAFRDRPPGNFLLLDTPEPCSLISDGSGAALKAVRGAVPGAHAVVLPAPLARRHQLDNTCLHLTAEFGAVNGENPIRIGLAHGTVQTFSDQSVSGAAATNYLVPDPIVRSGDLDYLALGDWHGARSLKVGERAWYSGTPEPTDFGQANAGQVNVVTIAQHGAQPSVETHRVARSAWDIISYEGRLLEANDLDSLREQVESGGPLSDRLIQLTVTGSLPLEVWATWEQILKQYQDTCRFFECDTRQVRLRVEINDIENWKQQRQRPLEPVLDSLVTRLSEAARRGDAQAPVAQRALIQIIDLIGANDAIGGAA